MINASKSRVPLYAFIAFFILMGAVPADAHLNTTGMGPLYDGLMHFLMSPEDFVPVLALALLSGLRGATYGRRALLQSLRHGSWVVCWGYRQRLRRAMPCFQQFGSCCWEDCLPLTPSSHYA